MAYSIFRFFPEKKEMEDLILEVEKTLSRQKEIDLPGDPQADLDRLKKEERGIEEELARMRVSIASLEEKFAPLDSPEILHGLQVEISEMGRANGVRILKNDPYEPKPSQGGAKSTSVPSEAASFKLYSRPMRKLELVTSYEGIKRFIQGLNRLKWRVSIIEFSIGTAQSTKEGQGSGPLSVTILISL